MDEYAILQNAGLGWKRLDFPGNGSAVDVHRAIVDAFPALADIGYELLQASSSGDKKRLQVIQAPTEGFSVGLLRAMLVGPSTQSWFGVLPTPPMTLRIQP
jgi:hypothetical protein